MQIDMTYHDEAVYARRYTVTHSSSALLIAQPAPSAGICTWFRLLGRSKQRLWKCALIRELEAICCLKQL